MVLIILLNEVKQNASRFEDANLLLLATNFEHIRYGRNPAIRIDVEKPLFLTPL